MTKLQDLAVKLSSLVQTNPNNTRETFEQITLQILQECMSLVRSERKMTLPDFTFKRCNNAEFLALLKQYNAALDKYAAYGVTIQRGPSRIVAINIEGPVEALKNNFESYIGNITLPIIEELVHLLYPTYSEEQVHPIVVELGEKYLEYKLPVEWKKESEQLLKDRAKQS